MQSDELLVVPDDEMYERIPNEETGLVLAVGMLANLLVVLFVRAILGAGAGVAAGGFAAVALALYCLHRRSIRRRT